MPKVSDYPHGPGFCNLVGLDGVPVFRVEVIAIGGNRFMAAVQAPKPIGEIGGKLRVVTWTPAAFEGAIHPTAEAAWIEADNWCLDRTP